MIVAPHVLASTQELHRRFVSAAPFPYVVIDGFFDDAYARRLIEEFPRSTDAAPNRFGAPGGKSARPDLRALGGAYAQADGYFSSPAFLAWIGEVTGIDGLLYDPANYGGGTHENFEGRDLRPHVDFNYHPVSKLHRRVNLIVYLNDEWERAWGGAIALYRDPRDPLDEPVAYDPTFNRCIVFETSEHSWHGFDRLNFPADGVARSRKSLSIYLYTKDRPESEIAGEHTTFFIPRALPSYFVAGRTLSAQDERELGELVGQRDRLIALYQREQGRREAWTVEAAHLRQRCAELELARGVPTLGYARTSAVRGPFPDGWASREMRFELRPERDANAIIVRLRLPEGLPHAATLELLVDGVSWQRTTAGKAVVEVRGIGWIPAHAPAEVRVTSDVTVNPKKQGISADERDLGFYIEEVRVEHDER